MKNAVSRDVMNHTASSYPRRQYSSLLQPWQHRTSFVLYWRLIITFDGSSVISPRHLLDTVARCSLLSVVRCILAPIHWDSFTLKTEAICSPDTSVLTRTTRRRNFLEDSILQCQLLLALSEKLIIVNGSFWSSCGLEFMLKCVSGYPKFDLRPGLLAVVKLCDLTHQDWWLQLPGFSALWRYSEQCYVLAQLMNWF
jgi:hypothetical protein